MHPSGRLPKYTQTRHLRLACRWPADSIQARRLTHLDGGRRPAREAGFFYSTNDRCWPLASIRSPNRMTALRTVADENAGSGQTSLCAHCGPPTRYRARRHRRSRLRFLGIALCDRPGSVATSPRQNSGICGRLPTYFRRETHIATWL